MTPTADTSFCAEFNEQIEKNVFHLPRFVNEECNNCELPPRDLVGKNRNICKTSFRRNITLVSVYTKSVTLALIMVCRVDTAGDNQNEHVIIFI